MTEKPVLIWAVSEPEVTFIKLTLMVFPRAQRREKVMGTVNTF